MIGSMEKYTCSINRIRRQPWFLKIILIVLISFCIQILPVHALTPQEEETISKEFMNIIFNYYERVEDPMITSYVEGIGRRIAQTLPPQPFEYNFYVIKEDSFNAFATPGGHIFIHTGLILKLDSEEELAGIMAHEIAHVSLRHIAKGAEFSKRVGMGTLAGMALGLALALTGIGALATAAFMGSMAAGQTAQLSYSRQNESQADQFGLTYLTNTGYNIKGFANSFQKMRAQQWWDSKSIPPYLLTHPMSDDRWNTVESYLETHPHQPPNVNPKHYNQVKVETLALYTEPNTALKYFEQGMKIDPGNFLYPYGQGMVLARLNRNQEAIATFQKSLSLNALDPYALKELSKLYYKLEGVQKALPLAQSALHLSPNDPELLYLLARFESSLGHYDTARNYIQILLDKNLRYPKAYLELGTVSEKLGNLSESSYYLGIYNQEIGKLDVSRRHLQKAVETLPEGEKKQDATDRLKIVQEVLKQLQRG